jgi:ubiquitin C-terminal hydrolase
MNSVLQCLSNTRLLLEWCLNENYLRDINTTTSSMKGALVKGLLHFLHKQLFMMGHSLAKTWGGTKVWFIFYTHNYSLRVIHLPRLELEIDDV